MSARMPAAQGQFDALDSIDRKYCSQECYVMEHPRRGRKDANHDVIAQTFRDLGCSVIDTHRLGHRGFPDLVLGVAGETLVVEVKNPTNTYGRKGLSKSQLEFEQTWRGPPIQIIRSRDEAIAFVTQVRKRLRQP